MRLASGDHSPEARHVRKFLVRVTMLTAGGSSTPKGIRDDRHIRLSMGDEFEHLQMIRRGWIEQLSWLDEALVLQRMQFEYRRC